MIIAIEGIDGAGKSTLMRTMTSAFDAQVMAFPRYSDSIFAKLAQRALYGKMGDLTASAHGMATLFALDRADAAEALSRFAANPNEHVLVDRFVASNAAYTTARTGDAESLDWVAQLEFEELGVPVPDLQIFLATPPELAIRRASERAAQDATRHKDEYEKDDSLQHRVDQAYHMMSAQEWASPWIVVHPDTEPEAVVAQVSAHIETSQ